MMFFPEIQLEERAAEAIARGLYAVAKADGVHERESALIASFWAEVGGGATALAELERRPDIRGTELQAALHEPTERTLFLKTALLLAWADGKVTPEERQVIGEFASALGITPVTIEALDATVKEYLLSHLAHLNNTDATRTVAKKLKL
jgi:tellurite resistance protein